MGRFIEGQDRRQATLLPDCLDDYVAEDNPVRVVEAFVDELDLSAGLAGVVAKNHELRGAERQAVRVLLAVTAEADREVDEGRAP